MADLSPSTVADLVARLDHLETRTEALEAENRALREVVAERGSRRGEVDDALPSSALPPAPVAGVATMPPPTAVTSAEGEGAEVTSVGRRSVLTKGLAAAGAAAAGAALLDAAPAAAANGQPILIGGGNTGTGTTVLSGSTFYAGVSSAVALYGVSTNGGGAYVFGGTNHLWFGPSTTRNPPTSDGVAHQQGEVVFDRFGNLWLCTVGGTPGTWRSMAGNGSVGAFYPLSPPLRTYDSRPGTTPSQGPKTKLAANTTRTISLSNIGATGLIPTVGVLLNVLLVNATAGNGNFTVWEAATAVPQANTMVWGGSAGRFSSLAFTTIDEAGRINLRASLATDVVIDVLGLYR